MAKSQQYVLKKSLHFTKHKFYGRVGDTFLYTQPPESKVVVSRNGDLVANFPLPEASLLGLVHAGYFESVLQDAKEDVIEGVKGVVEVIKSTAAEIVSAVKDGEGVAGVTAALTEGATEVKAEIKEAAQELGGDVKNEVVVIADTLGLAEQAKAEIAAQEGLGLGDEDHNEDADVNEDTGEVTGESAEVKGKKKATSKSKKPATSN